MGSVGRVAPGDTRPALAAQRGHHVAGRDRLARRVLDLLKRRGPLPRRKVGAHVHEDVVEHAHAVLLPPRVGCLAPPIVPRHVSRPVAAPAQGIAERDETAAQR